MILTTFTKLRCFTEQAIDQASGACLIHDGIQYGLGTGKHFLSFSTNVFKQDHLVLLKPNAMLKKPKHLECEALLNNHRHHVLLIKHHHEAQAWKDTGIFFMIMDSWTQALRDCLRQYTTQITKHFKSRLTGKQKFIEHPCIQQQLGQVQVDLQQSHKLKQPDSEKAKLSLLKIRYQSMRMAAAQLCQLYGAHGMVQGGMRDLYWLLVWIEQILDGSN